MLVTGAVVWGVKTRAAGFANGAGSLIRRDLQSVKASFIRPERIPFPPTNPFSEAKYQLGRTLFFDPRLSGAGAMACATCHNPALNWTDGQGRATGNGHKALDRKSPSLLNAAWGILFFWDGRADSLEQQALGPIQSEAEMNLKIPELVKRLQAVGEYGRMFKAAFPGEAISGDTIAKAIATFERTIVSDIAPFDRWIAGEESAVNESAKRGFALFNGQAACVKCHNGWNFTNGSFADIGLQSDDRGREKIEHSPALAHGFKVPTLRNIARRAPYMHDGSLPDLAAVLENYNAGGTVRRPTTQLFLKPLGLTDRDKTDLRAFLETLNSEDERVTAPTLPPGER
jgi:cytochrome c peroxidase